MMTPADRHTAAVLVITNDPDVEAVVSPLLRAGIPAKAVATHSEALRFIQEAPRCLAVLDGTMDEEVALPVYRLLHEESPTPTLLLLSSATYQRFVHDPQRPPSDDFTFKPLGLDELVQRIKAAMLHAQYELPPVPAVPLPAEEIMLDSLHRGKLVVVCSAKGGVGTTTLAINIAVGLQTLHGQKTLLVDADLAFGSVGVLLNLAPGPSLAEAASEADPSVLTLQRALVAHPSGLMVLPRPATPLTAAHLDPTLVVQAIGSYRAFFDYVVVDTHPAFDDLNLQLFDAADRLLLVTTPEVAASHNVAGFLDMAESLNYAGRIDLILNRANSGVRNTDLARSLRLPIAATVVSAGREAVDAANRGIPLLLLENAGRSRIVEDIRGVVHLVMAERRRKPVAHGPAGQFGARSRRLWHDLVAPFGIDR